MPRPAPLTPPVRQRRALMLAAAAVTATLVAGCVSRPEAPAPTAPAPPSKPAAPAAAAPTAGRTSSATSARDYRRDAAGHLYGLNADRVYKGRLPPMLYAVGVLQVELDPQGRVQAMHWMRAPRHAPEVMAEIERTVRQASPFPAPARLGRVTYTDTWLWHKSGRFQLDSLTEGQD